jgi:hypothetical protein
VLNLSGVASLRSRQLESLLADDLDSPISPLRVLMLNKTGIDDTAAPYISMCRSLETLEVGGTKLTSEYCSHQESTCVELQTGEGLYVIIDGCPRLERLDLTSCRGIPVAQRRNFFDVRPAQTVDETQGEVTRYSFRRHTTKIGRQALDEKPS